MRILLAGLGSIGQRHARNLRSLLGDQAELIAYRQRGTSPLINPDMTVDREADVERAYGIRAFTDLDEALAERPDAVFVTNPNHLHVPVALAAAAAGAHLFIEKPLSHDLAGIERLIEVVEANGLTCLIGCQLRFDPGFRLLQQLVAQESVGVPIAVRIAFGEYLPGWHPYEDYRQLHVSRSDEGGGVLLAQIHDLDLAYALFGRPRRVFALGGKRSSLDVDVEDVASVLLDCDGLPVHVQQDLVRRPAVRTYEVIGETGTLLWDQQAGLVRVMDGESVNEQHQVGIERNEAFLSELRHFLACLDGREQPIVDIRAGAEVLRVCLAAKQSLATREAVALP